MAKLVVSVVALLLCGVFSTGAGAADGQIVITHAKALAGNVTPGDVAGYPAMLSLRGSYVLGSNLTPGPGLDGIVAAAPDIALDLNGFTMSGGPAGGSNNARIGIYGQADRLTVKNGTIGAFVTAGLYAPSRPYLIVENMRIINSGYGVYGGGSTRIQNSTVVSNRSTGIVCGSSCHVEGNVVSGNAGYGIDIFGGVVLGNTISSNTLYGIIARERGVGFGNNSLVGNNGNNAQVTGVAKLQPNLCYPVLC